MLSQPSSVPMSTRQNQQQVMDCLTAPMYTRNANNDEEKNCAEAPATWSAFDCMNDLSPTAPVSNTNPGQYPQQTRSQVAQQYVPPRPGTQFSPTPSLAALPGTSTITQLTEQEFRELQHKRLDEYLTSMLAKPQGAVTLDRSQSDQGAAPVSMHRPTSSRSLDCNAQTPAPQDWQMYLQRPHTPANQNGPEYSPITPAQTPHSHCGKRNGPQTPVHHMSPCVEHSTIKATRSVQASAGALQAVMEDFVADDGYAPLSPPSTVRVGQQRKFDATTLDDGAPLDEIPKFTFPQNGTTSAIDFESSGRSWNGHKAHQSSVSTFGGSSRGDRSNRSSVDLGAAASPSNMVPRHSRDKLETGMYVEDTGISSEEVLSYMQEDSADPKTPFTCTYEGCGKTFGRRENIRSHIQTHLDDRQFVCLDCNKRFVRQHDLKRHTKIHTKEKPHKCACGNGFARQDALTRHRQRGICRGGFEGVVRTPVKRGRPRKNRPNDEDRVDKSARQRKRNVDRSHTYSASESSGQSSAPSPAGTSNEDLNVDESLAMSLQQMQHLQNFTISTEDMFLATAVSQAASVTNSHADSQLGSQAGSPPELSHSSPPTSARMMDCDSLLNQNEDSNALPQSAVPNGLEGMAYDNNFDGMNWAGGSLEYLKDSEGYGNFGEIPLFSGLDS